MNRLCPNCGKKLVRRNNEKLNSYRNRKYCNRECYISYSSRETEIKSCANCGKEIIRRRSDRDNSKSGNSFCCRSCRVSYFNKERQGNNHPNFTHGLSVSYRQKALDYYGCKCTVCGYDVGSVLEVHHKDCNRRNNRIENLDVLCPTHHKEYQYGIRKYI